MSDASEEYLKAHAELDAAIKALGTAESNYIKAQEKVARASKAALAEWDSYANSRRARSAHEGKT